MGLLNDSGDAYSQWLSGLAGMGFEFLAQSSLRISVFVKSVWTYITRQREHTQSFFVRRREKFANARLAFNRTNRLHLAGTLLSRERQRRSAVDLSNLSLIDVGRDRPRAEQPGVVLDPCRKTHRWQPKTTVTRLTRQDMSAASLDEEVRRNEGSPRARISAPAVSGRRRR